MKASSENSLSNNPFVSVVMPAFNAAATIRRAIESILAQTYTDFEFIIIDDGSTDDTRDIVREFTDSRMRLLVHATNLGLARTLNDGVQAARGQLIARMDADDESLPTRLEAQVSFMRDRADIACVGTAALAVYEKGRSLKKLWRPAHPLATGFLSLFETPLLHPTVVGRIEAFRRHHYDTSLPRSEDYDLWSRMLESGLRLANISRPLLRYRIHSASFTKKSGTSGSETVVRITLRNMQRYCRLSESETAAVTAYRAGRPLPFVRLGTFFFLTLRLAGAYCRKERGAVWRLPTLLRIMGSVMLRITRRSTRS